MVGSVPSLSVSGSDEAISWVRRLENMAEVEVSVGVGFSSIAAVLVTAVGLDADKGCSGERIEGRLDVVLVVCGSLRAGFHIAVEGTVGDSGKLGALADPEQRACVTWKVPNPPTAANLISVDSARGVVTYGVTVPAFTASWGAPVTVTLRWVDDYSPAGNGVTSTSAATVAQVTRRGNFFPGLKVVYLDPVNGCPSEEKTVLSGAGSCSAWNAAGSFISGLAVTATPGIDLASYSASYTVSVPSYPLTNGAPVTVTLRWADSLALAGEMVVPSLGGPFALPLAKRAGPGFLVFPGLRVTVTSIGCPSNEAYVQPSAMAPSAALEPPKGTTVFLDSALPSYPSVAPLDGEALSVWKDRSGLGNDVTATGDVKFRVTPGNDHGFVQARGGYLGKNAVASGTFSGSEYTLSMVLRPITASASNKRYVSLGDATGNDSDKGVTFEPLAGGFTSSSRYALGDGVRAGFTSQLLTGWVGLPAAVLPVGIWSLVSLTVRRRIAYLTINSQDWVANHDLFSGSAFLPTKLCVANAAQGASACDTSATLVGQFDAAAVLVWPRALSRSEIEELKLWAKARYQLPELHPRCSIIDKTAARASCLAVMARWLLVPAAPVPKLLVSADDPAGTGTTPTAGSSVAALTNLSPAKTSGSDSTCATIASGTVKYVGAGFPSGRGYIEFRQGYCYNYNTQNLFTSSNGAFTLMVLVRSFMRQAASVWPGLVSMTKTGNDNTDVNGFIVRGEPSTLQRALMIDRAASSSPGRTDIDTSLLQDRFQTVGGDFRLLTFTIPPSRRSMINIDGYTRDMMQYHATAYSVLAPQRWAVGARILSGPSIDTTAYSNMDLANLQVFDRWLTWSERQIVRGNLYQSYKLPSLAPNCTMVERRFRHWCHTLQEDLYGVDLPRDGLVGEFSSEDPLGTGRHPATGSTISSWANLAKPAAGGGIGDLAIINSPTFVHNAINGRPALRLNSGSHVGTATIGSGVFPGNAGTVMIVNNPLGTAGSTVWSGGDTAGIVGMGRQAAPACDDYRGADGISITNHVATSKITKWLKSWGNGGEDANRQITNARILRPALTIAAWDQGSSYFLVGRSTLTGTWSGRSSFSPDMMCINGRYNSGSASCSTLGAGADYAAVFIWNKKLSTSELETAKLYAMRAYKLDLDVDCTQVASSVRATCDLEAGFLPAELEVRVALQLDADNYDATALAKDFPVAVTQWKNLRDSWLVAQNPGSTSGATHGTCPQNGGYPRYNVYAPSSGATFLNNRGHIELRSNTYCLADFGAYKLFPSFAGDSALGLQYGRTVAILFRSASAGADTQAILDFGVSTATAAHQSGISLEFRSGTGLWWVSRLDDSTNSLGFSATGTVSGATIDSTFAVTTNEWTLGIFRVTNTGAFAMLNNKKFYDKTSGVSSPATATNPTLWGVGTRIQSAAASSTTWADLDIAFAYAFDSDLQTTEIELLRLWAKRRYGLAGITIDCGEVPPRYMAVCTSATAA